MPAIGTGTGDSGTMVSASQPLLCSISPTGATKENRRGRSQGSTQRSRQPGITSVPRLRSGTRVIAIGATLSQKLEPNTLLFLLQIPVAPERGSFHQSRTQQAADRHRVGREGRDAEESILVLGGGGSGLPDPAGASVIRAGTLAGEPHAGERGLSPCTCETPCPFTDARQGSSGSQARGPDPQGCFPRREKGQGRTSSGTTQSRFAQNVFRLLLWPVVNEYVLPKGPQINIIPLCAIPAVNYCFMTNALWGRELSKTAQHLSQRLLSK